MTNEKRQALLERLVGHLLLKNREMRVLKFYTPEVIEGREVLVWLERLTPENHNALEAFMAEYGRRDFGFVRAGKDNHVLILGAKAPVQVKGKDGVSEFTRRDLWRTGRIHHNGTTYTYRAKIHDVGSQYGIKGGRISKLQIAVYATEKTILHYDRGWDIRPTTANAKAVLKAILAAYPNKA